MNNPTIDSSYQAYLYLRPLFKMNVEEFWALALSSTKEAIATELLFRGTVDTCLFHPRDLIRFVCLANASSVIVAHNHPSGNPRPSQQDLRVTLKLERSCRLIQVPLDDHIVIAKNSYFSFLDQRTPPFHKR